MRATRNAVEAQLTITARWDDTTKTWRLLAQGRNGVVLGREVADTTVPIDRGTATAVLRAVRRELELLLPF